jgi:hypothetical protein
MPGQTATVRQKHGDDGVPFAMSQACRRESGVTATSIPAHVQERHP